MALLGAARPVVPTFMALQRHSLRLSAERHNVPGDVLAAVLYNEMLGQEYRFLSAAVPGQGAVSRFVEDSLLGWHFLTLKQAQWIIKTVASLAGLDTTVGPTGIRVSVGREIRSEVAVAGGRYRPTGLAERPSLVLDLSNPSSAIEYLAANLERGRLRSAPDQAGDWAPLARWHNTGLTADRPDVPRPVWDKGTRYVARVQMVRPLVTNLINQETPPLRLALLAGQTLASLTASTRLQRALPLSRLAPAAMIAK
jgi:hypothetical protein